MSKRYIVTPNRVKYPNLTSLEFECNSPKIAVKKYADTVGIAYRDVIQCTNKVMKDVEDVTNFIDVFTELVGCDNPISGNKNWAYVV